MCAASAAGVSSRSVTTTSCDAKAAGPGAPSGGRGRGATEHRTSAPGKAAFDRGGIIAAFGSAARCRSLLRPALRKVGLRLCLGWQQDVGWPSAAGGSFFWSEQSCSDNFGKLAHPAKMGSTEICKKRADEAHTRAEQSVHPGEQEAWLRVASEWSKLAQTRGHPIKGVMGALTRIYSGRSPRFP
jgi:hypothetical protein